jgi:hypothetical protein
MRLSLTLIPTFFFLKSFASGEQTTFSWFNENAVLGDCTPTDVAKIDNDVELMFYNMLGHPVYDWVPGLSCTQFCNNRCKNTPYMCYGGCSGCGRRTLTSVDRELYSEEQLENQCTQVVRASTGISSSCALAVEDAWCDVTV